MWKASVVLILILFNVAESKAGDKEFYNSVLSDFGLQSSFVAIDVLSDDYDGRVIIENLNLYTFLYRQQALDEDTYKKRMLRMFLANERLDLRGTKLDVKRFIKIKEDPDFDAHADQDREAFLLRYFDGRVIKSGLEPSLKYAIISKLFDWRIVTYTDDFSGYLVYRRFDK